MKDQFVEQYKQEFPVVVMGRVLEVSRSVAFTPGASVPPASVIEKMLTSRKQFSRYLICTRAGYGSPRIYRELKEQGRKTSRKRVARLMREAALFAKRKRRRVLTTRRSLSHPVAPNVLHRQFTAAAPNTKWVTDITSIPTTQGWLYLAVILDLYSRAVAGWSMLPLRYIETFSILLSSKW
ncbi:MAG TPA: IS3 family transposase [Ktedonobacteraceae bacterium]|nr:IS3 family transposase [Ktedonobacteraceae bacterium]